MFFLFIILPVAVMFYFILTGQMYRYCWFGTFWFGLMFVLNLIFGGLLSLIVSGLAFAWFYYRLQTILKAEKPPVHTDPYL